VIDRDRGVFCVFQALRVTSWITMICVDMFGGFGHRWVSVWYLMMLALGRLVWLVGGHHWMGWTRVCGPSVLVMVSSFSAHGVLFRVNCWTLCLCNYTSFRIVK
jgi:hypothetical protein